MITLECVTSLNPFLAGRGAKEVVFGLAGKGNGAFAITSPKPLLGKEGSKGSGLWSGRGSVSGPSPRQAEDR